MFPIFLHIPGVLEAVFAALLWLLWQLVAHLVHPWEIKECKMGMKPKITPNNVQYGHTHFEQGQGGGNLAMVNPWPAIPSSLGPWWHSCHCPGRGCQPTQEEYARYVGRLKHLNYQQWFSSLTEAVSCVIRGTFRRPLRWKCVSSKWPSTAGYDIFHMEQPEKDFIKQKVMATLGSWRNPRDKQTLKEQLQFPEVSRDMILWSLNVAAWCQHKYGLMSLWDVTDIQNEKSSRMIFVFVFPVYNVLAFNNVLIIHEASISQYADATK